VGLQATFSLAFVSFPNGESPDKERLSWLTVIIFLTGSLIVVGLMIYDILHDMARN
jgi:hypothetical protein